MRILITAVILSLSTQASAAIVERFGTNLKFTYDDSSLFGTLDIVGDSITFLPTDFRSISLNGEGVVTTVETLQIQVETINAGQSMTGFSLFEDGDYELSPGATAEAGGELGVTSRTKVDPGTTFAYRDFDIFDTGPLLVAGPVSPWTAGASVNLADSAGWGSDTSVTLTLQNWLSATTLALGQEAEIQKKFVGVSIAVVPIPAAVWLFASGLAGLAAMRRKKIA